MNTDKVILNAIVKERVARWRAFQEQLPEQVSIPSLKGLKDDWGGSIDTMDAIALSAVLTGKREMPIFFVFSGTPGTGKTSMAAAVAKQLFVTGRYKSLQYVTGSDLLWELSYGNDRGPQPVKRYVNSDILVLDDLGVTDPNLTATRREGIWSIVNSRWGRGTNAVTIITTNAKITQGADTAMGKDIALKTILGESAYDRVMDEALVINFSGKSKRLNRNR